MVLSRLSKHSSKMQVYWVTLPALLIKSKNPSFIYCILVPTARLELAQPKPLPPQDSVSTNFTTSASCKTH